MERKFNETAFTPEEVEKGLHLDLINYLLDYNQRSENRYNDIHITSDGYCTIVQWIDRGYEDHDNGKFEFVDIDQCVMTECILPDNSVAMCFDQEDADDHLEEFLKENPNYKKNEYGRWVETF